MNETLVVFFSRSGNTRRLAEQLARELSADLDEIREPASRAGVLGFLRSGYEALRGVEPAILAPARAPGAYGRVLIGTPVWAGRMSSPVRSYLVKHRAELRHAAFFCTYGGSGGDRCLAGMAALLGHPADAALALNEREAVVPHHPREESFVNELRAHPA